MLSLLKKKWCLADVSSEKSSTLAEELNIPFSVAILLINRGVDNVKEGNLYLKSDFSLLHDPFLMTGMDKAVERVIRAIENEESITVFCDYDVDGVTSAAFLTHFSRDLNCHIGAYLPEREEEGYGLNSDAVQKIRSQGANLMILSLIHI